MAELTVSQVAGRLGLGERHTRTLLSGGKISGRQLPSGEWLADSDSVARYQLRRKPPGRSLHSDTAWAILYELSGINAASMLPKATYARVRKRIRQMEPEALAIAVSGHAIGHRYRSANAVKAQSGLVRTGRAASDLIASDLLPDARRVQGYVPVGVTVADYARDHFMIEDSSGPDILYENTAPDGLAKALPGVVAADLALSTDARERSAGISALGALINEWLLSHVR